MVVQYIAVQYKLIDVGFMQDMFFDMACAVQVNQCCSNAGHVVGRGVKAAQIVRHGRCSTWCTIWGCCSTNWSWVCCISSSSTWGFLQYREFDIEPLQYKLLDMGSLQYK